MKDKLKKVREFRDFVYQIAETKGEETKIDNLIDNLIDNVGEKKIEKYSKIVHEFNSYFEVIFKKDISLDPWVATLGASFTIAKKFDISAFRLGYALSNFIYEVAQLKRDNSNAKLESHEIIGKCMDYIISSEENGKYKEDLIKSLKYMQTPTFYAKKINETFNDFFSQLNRMCLDMLMMQYVFSKKSLDMEKLLSDLNIESKENKEEIYEIMEFYYPKVKTGEEDNVDHTFFDHALYDIIDFILSKIFNIVQA